MAIKIVATKPLELGDAIKPEKKKAYSRIRSLGEERVQEINEWLMDGKPAMALAKKIQEEWGEFDDVNEKTLTQQLNRYRADLQVGAVFEARTAKNFMSMVKRGATYLQKINVMEQLEHLILMQKQRIEDALPQERLMKLPIKQVNVEMHSMLTMLEKLQKLRFELGLDTYQGPVLQSGKQQTQTVTLPNGMVVTNQVTEAMESALILMEDPNVLDEQGREVGEFVEFEEYPDQQGIENDADGAG